MVSRRRVLQRWAAVHAALIINPRWPAGSRAEANDDVNRQTPLAPADDQFLEELEKAGFAYFWEQSDPHTGLVKDRNAVNADKRAQNKEIVASIAATGFGLTALC